MTKDTLRQIKICSKYEVLEIDSQDSSIRRRLICPIKSHVADRSCTADCAAFYFDRHPISKRLEACCNFMVAHLPIGEIIE